MRALVIYESMYGNTHAVADAIAEGLAPDVEVEVLPVHDAGTVSAEVDPIVVGGPTHVHGLSTSTGAYLASSPALRQVVT